MAINKWSNVQVAIQSALATALTITAITKANPGVATYTGTDPSNGDYVKLEVLGMHQVTDRVFRVAGVDGGANTFQLEGEDTTLYETFTSGTAQVITFGTTMTTAIGLAAAGGDPSFLDTTTIHANIASQIPGISAPASYTFDNFWDPSDSALVALKAASEQQAERAIRFAFATGHKIAFLGYVACTMLPVGEAQQLVKTTVTVTMQGRPSIWTT